MGFTFYGDLLGMSGYYNLSHNVAYRKLDDFYNTTFSSFASYCRNNQSVSVQMFSDSLLIWGDDPEEVLEQLHTLYIKLINKGLLLRGAMVDSKLKIDPRITLENFKKFLPRDDTLARAVGLESTQKGARLLIENSLADKFLSHHPDWMTNEGYLTRIKPQVPLNSILRRIIPTPDNKTYEFLYFWVDSHNNEQQDIDYSDKGKILKELSEYLRDDIALHYDETEKLLHRSQSRQKMTEERVTSQATLNRV